MIFKINFQQIKETIIELVFVDLYQKFLVKKKTF